MNQQNTMKATAERVKVTQQVTTEVDAIRLTLTPEQAGAVLVLTGCTCEDTPEGKAAGDVFWALNAAGVKSSARLRANAQFERTAR